MSKVIAQPGQTLMDLAIQYAGDASALFEIAHANELNITDDLTPGQVIIIPSIFNERVAKYFEKNNLYPAVIEQNPREGIGYWIIGQNFIVS